MNVIFYPEHLNQNSFVRNNPSIIHCFLFFKPGEIYCSPKMMRYEEENEKLADSSPCAGVRADLKMCLLESDCCRVLKKTPRECLKSEDGTVPTECQVLRNTFFECKRSLFDAPNMGNK